MPKLKSRRAAEKKGFGKGMVVRGGRVVPEQVSMPVEKSKVATRLEDYSILLFGKKKIGKTTLAREFKNVFFFPTEPGTKAIGVYQPIDANNNPIVIERWPQFCGYIEWYKKKKKSYGPSCVDVVDKAYEIGFDYMCNDVLHIEHPNAEKDYGQSWQAINKEIMRALKILLSDKRGCILISHTKTREIEDPLTGEKKDQVQCSLSGKFHEEITGIVDIWAYYTYDKGERRLYIHGDGDVDCGTRIEDRFLDPNTGEQIDYIPMGRSSKESYENFIKAFENELSIEEKEHKKKGGVRLKKKTKK